MMATLQLLSDCHRWAQAARADAGLCCAAEAANVTVYGSCSKSCTHEAQAFPLPAQHPWGLSNLLNLSTLYDARDRSLSLLV
jgi:hypothetical protein